MSAKTQPMDARHLVDLGRPVWCGFLRGLRTRTDLDESRRLMHRVWTRLWLCGVVLPMVTPWAGVGQGHGPVYGLSTPTLGRGGWSLDVAGMGRFLGADRTMMIRPMLSYGVTEDLQVSASLPIPVASSSAIPSARAFTRMPASRDVEMMVGWRVQRRGTGVGARQETTVWLAADVPTESSRDGLQTAPSVFGSAVTGYASRSIYAWLGVRFEPTAWRDVTP